MSAGGFSFNVVCYGGAHFGCNGSSIFPPHLMTAKAASFFAHGLRSASTQSNTRNVCQYAGCQGKYLKLACPNPSARPGRYMAVGFSTTGISAPIGSRDGGLALLILCFIGTGPSQPTPATAPGPGTSVEVLGSLFPQFLGAQEGYGALARRSMANGPTQSS